MPKDLIPKAYVNTSRGQLHYRRSGTGNRSLLLIHWLPLSSRMYATVMPELAELGYDVIALDLLGYGRSDPRPEQWSMEMWADNVHEAMEQLCTRPVTAVGGHSGACVVTEIALRHPDAVENVILDGCPLPTPELTKTFAAMRQNSRPGPTADLGHEALVFRTVRTTYEHYVPGFTVTPQTIEAIWPAMIDYLETDFVSSAPISVSYDLAARLPQIRQPLALLSAMTDTLFGNHARACTLAATAQQHVFEGHHPLHDPARCREYAQVIARFSDRRRVL